MICADATSAASGCVSSKVYVDELTDLQEAQGEIAEALQTQETLHRIMASRNVLPRVLAEIDERRQALRAETGVRPSKKGKGKGN